MVGIFGGIFFHTTIKTRRQTNPEKNVPVFPVKNEFVLKRKFVSKRANGVSCGILFVPKGQRDEVGLREKNKTMQDAMCSLCAHVCIFFIIINTVLYTAIVIVRGNNAGGLKMFFFF